LLDGSQFHVELVRSRLKAAAGGHKFQSLARAAEANAVANFKTKTKWSDFSETFVESK
jgi:hypothetical protein